jgi:putative GTP pyrophosphokinase
MKVSDPDRLKSSYDALFPVAERFAKRLAEQIGEVLVSNQISLAVPIEWRVKSLVSLSEKIENKKLEVVECAQVNDFVGLRLILLFRRDVDRVIGLLSNSLNVTASEDATERLGVEAFGYQSVHLQVQLPPEWGKVPTFRDFSGLRAEVQVRTAAQHIWAAASHVLQYKSATSVPKQVLPSVNRVAALLETVDLEFERALLEKREYARDAGASLRGSDGDLTNETLNVDLLERVLDQVLPPENKDESEDYEEILNKLLEAKISKVDALTRLIHEKLDDALRFEKEVVSALIESGEPDAADGTIAAEVRGNRYRGRQARLDRGVFYTHQGLVTYMLTAGSRKIPRRPRPRQPGEA